MLVREGVREEGVTKPTISTAPMVLHERVKNVQHFWTHLKLAFVAQFAKLVLRNGHCG